VNLRNFEGGQIVSGRFPTPNRNGTGQAAHLEKAWMGSGSDSAARAVKCLLD
jgi:hypothetical protein